MCKQLEALTIFLVIFRDITKDEDIATALLSIMKISSTGENTEGAGDGALRG